MSDLLSFIAGNLKQQSMTVDEFCRKVGISRQKFYRFVKEPRRFSGDQIRSIIEVLSLSDSEVQTLESYMYLKASPGVTPDSVDYSNVISDIFSRSLSRELSLTANNIEYTGTDGTVTMESSVSLARIMSGVSPGRRKADPGVRISHDFKFTIYNCVPTAEDIASKKVRRTDKWIMTITQIVKELDDLLLPIADTSIRVRHYVSHRERFKLSQAENEDRDAMLLNLHVLNTVLPLLSLAEDYDMDQTQVLRRFWFDSRDVCLIRHTSRIAADSSEVPGRSGDGNELSSTMYYLLVFTNVGDCYACCLGSEEASHIYRFFSIDSTAKETLPAEKTRPVNPNQSFYQIGSQHKTAMIHPDLCFDSVPPNLWLALYRDVASRGDRALFEQIFRNLIDPFDQYAFLSFKDLVYAAVDTLQQRARSSTRFGRITICHPEGLQNLVRTGMLADLISDAVDYTGKTWSDTPLRFPASMVRTMLVMIRDNIQQRLASPGSDPIRAGENNFFILQPQYPYPEVSLVIYNELGIYPVYGRGPHKNTITNAYKNPAVGTLLYDYVANEMVRKRGGNLKSAIMSDEHSIILLDNLIAQLDREAASSEKGDRL